MTPWPCCVRHSRSLHQGRRQLLWPECELERGVRKVTNVFASERRALRARVRRPGSWGLNQGRQHE